MVWEPVGSIASDGGWRTVGEIASSLIRVRFSLTSPASGRVILGHLRQRWESELYDARWYKLYPKADTWELYQLAIPEEFKIAGFTSRFLEVKQSTPWRWRIEIEGWL
ncbi:MAG: hypothetical protein F6K42_34240 [Leptolyngbya sp. SIO1D8]|nr:hypothetical protein [Leptolyngbya sp. SIO1D8]